MEVHNESFTSHCRLHGISFGKFKKEILIGLNLKTHDLRRHAATFASRSGIPIEIISKIILRHSNLSTTQRYLGKVTDIEAIRWIENLHG